MTRRLFRRAARPPQVDPAAVLTLLSGQITARTRPPAGPVVHHDPEQPDLDAVHLAYLEGWDACRDAVQRLIGDLLADVHAVGGYVHSNSDDEGRHQ